MMRSKMTGWSRWRRVWAGCALAAAVAVGVVLGMSIAGTSEAAQAERTFDAPAGMMLNYVKSGSTADFEGVMTRLGDALTNSENLVRGEQASGWKIYKARESGPNDDVLYIWFLDPTVSGAEYSVSQILNEEFPAEVQALYETFNGSFGAGQVMINMDLVTEF